MELAAIENIVRIIFPLTMMRDGELLPAAFKLRDQQGGPEQYLSVFRQFADTFHLDIQNFDKGRNLPCCIMNVGEVNGIEMIMADKNVSYQVKAVPTPQYQSHGGIFISIGGFPLMGSGVALFNSLNIGEESAFHLVAIRRRLVDLAKKRITTVDNILKI